MSDKEREIKFNNELNENFDEIYKYIEEDSPKNAKEFAKEVKEKLKKIEKNPTAQSPEPALPSAWNWFRYVIIKKKWKIIFKVTKKLLLFMGIVHTSRHPKVIKNLRTLK